MSVTKRESAEARVYVRDRKSEGERRRRKKQKKKRTDQECQQRVS